MWRTPESVGDVLSRFRIFETEEFDRRVDALNRGDAEFIRRKLKSYVHPQLRNEPFFGRNIRKLRGYEPDTWRYRIGRSRLFYVVDQDNRSSTCSA